MVKTLTEIKKGCGNIIIKEKYSIDCGGKVKDNWGIWNIIYCPTCQALLKQAQEFEKIMNEVFDDCTGHEQDIDIFYYLKDKLLKEVQGEKGK